MGRQLVEAGRSLVGDLGQLPVGTDHVRRDALFPGLLVAPVAQGIEQRPVPLFQELSPLVPVFFPAR